MGFFMGETNLKLMQNYQHLQQLYLLVEINESCVDIDFAYAFICSMANGELELQQWMPMLFLVEEHSFSSEELASDFANRVLSIYQQAIKSFQNNTPLILSLEATLLDADKAIVNFANGYNQGLMLIDNLQLAPFAENSPTINLQQTCLLLLDKLSTPQTDDMQRLAFFEQLPNRDEIISLLPSLLANYGHQCLLDIHK